jgi:filamentous hemagglutinin family protein
MPPSTRFRVRLAAAALALHAAGAAANPQGGAVKAGAATIQSSGNRVDVVQSSQRAVIDWRSFSIGAREQVHFSQPSAAAATLNRVTGTEASSILGRLTANGTVFLLNPNGILIGPGAKIDVGGLIATTANISNENFMAGRLKFDEVLNRNAVIVNRGEITARAGGLVALVAPGVENSGVIRAELGRVVLASGNAFTLDLFGDRLVSFAVDDRVAARLTDVDGKPLAAYVNQAGTILADGGSVLLAASSAKAVLDSAINTSGVVRATSFVARPGEIVLEGGDGAVRVAGTLDASGRAPGATGGTVKVLGAEVALNPGSSIDVSGDAGGGTALVGGAGTSRATIAEGASVAADAIARGAGGTIVAWSDGATRFAGALSARGGAAGGDGGFVEVSGKGTLAFAGAVDLAAPAGKGGRLLLDPETIVVDAAAAAALGGVLRTGASAELLATDTIEVRERIDGRGGAAGGGLRLDAGNAIAVDDDILTNDGAIALRAGAGGIRMNAGPATSASGGNGVLLSAGNAPITLTAAGDVAARYLASGGAVTIETTTPGRTITLGGQILAGGNVRVGAPGLKTTTSIRLRHDVLAENGDIAFNGRTWIDPIVQPGGANVSYSNLFRLSTPRYYENPLVQVAVQTTGGGSVRFDGDVLWGGAADEKTLPQVRYVYNVLAPPPFDARVPAQVEALRAAQSPAATGYFGFNVGVERGRVELLGNLGMYTADGVKKFVAAPRDTLTRTSVPTVLSVAIDTWSFSRDAGTADIVLGAGSQATVGRFRIRNPASADPGYDSIDVAGASTVFGGAPRFIDVPIAGNMPNLRVSSGGPNLIAPSPRNVARPSSLAAAVPLPEIPVVAEAPATPGALAGAPAPDAGSLMRATLIDDPARGGSLRGAGPGAAPDVFETAAPIAPFAGERPAAADAEYFSQGAFDYVQSLARRTPAPR